MHQNLEKKLGEQSSEVSEAREAKKNIEVLLGAIYSKPEHYQQATSWIKEFLGQPQEEAKPSGGSEEAKTGAQPKAEEKPKVDDTRRALQNQILADFYKRHGLDKLPDDERKQEQAKIATSFAELADPGGTKSVSVLLDEVPLDRLPKYLESSYLLSSQERIAKESAQKGLLTAEEKRQASIGSLTSAGGERAGKMALTPKERAVAEKLGVSPEDYAKSKVEIEKKAKEL